MAAEYDLFSKWFRVADWCAYSLQKDGYEALVLSPLGRFPASATKLAEAAFQSDDYLHRKIAASLLGWIETPESHLLSAFFDRESKRDRILSSDSPAKLECQSVVEDLVFSGARWARADRNLPAALDFLAEVVARTVNRHYWNSASYAMTTLVLRDSSRFGELLDSFCAFADGPTPDHPSMPTLKQERQFAENLLRKNANTLGAIEKVLDSKGEALDTKLDPDSEQSIAELLSAAKFFDKNATETTQGAN